MFKSVKVISFGPPPSHCTYVDEILGVEDVRDLVAEQVLLGSPKSLNVDVLDDHLQTQEINNISHLPQTLRLQIQVQFLAWPQYN